LDWRWHARYPWQISQQPSYVQASFCSFDLFLIIIAVRA
jgi:hypothetical protein